MWNFLKNVFSPSYYIPHGHCYLWQTPLVWLHVVSDLMIAIAYFSIPIMLVYFIYKRRDIPFKGIFILFGAFIILCGTGHLLEIWTLWHPAYWLSGIEQAITALVSCYTAGQMVTLLPQFLSLKTPEELEAINQKLQHEVVERQTAQEALNQQFKLAQLVSKMLDRIRSSLDLEAVLQTAVDEVRQFLQTDRVIIYQFNPDWSGYVTVESVGENWMSLLGIDIQDRCFRDKHLSLYQKGRIRAIADIQNSDLTPCHINLLSRFQVRANLVLPILSSEETSHNQLWGLLIAHHCSGARQWQEFEIECLRQLSIQLAIALQQCNLFKQAQTELAERKQAEAALRQSEAREREKAQQLKLALHRLKKTQAQIIQSEKMASLGQMVAGVAHEINNPVSFIYSNITPALEYADSLLNLISLYQQQYSEPPAVIQQQLEELDIDFVKQDFIKLLQSMAAGSERIRKIVLSLRNFSRLDESEKKAADLHQGIDSTLMILQHRLKPQSHCPMIEVIKDYGILPLVDCYPGQLNQVFMNLLSNAIDVLEEKLESDLNFNPKIWIRTQVQEDVKNSSKRSVIISIADNGLGIPEQIKPYIFDPFFTTKPVGKGTGLGLSISYQIIVEKHKGNLECRSRLGEGTEFYIELVTEA